MLPWQKLWLSGPCTIHFVPGTDMIEIHGVQGFLTPGDVKSLVAMAATIPPGGCYLEIGSWLGLSSILIANGLLAELNFRAHIFCVDTWEGSAEHQHMPQIQQGQLYEQFQHNITTAGVESLISAIRGESQEIAQRWTGPLLDVIFIDGDHSLAGCYGDLQAWHPKLKQDGRLLGHDASPGSEVEAAVRQYCRENRWTASVCPLPGSHYIWEIHTTPSALAPGHQWLESGPNSGR